MMRKRGNRFELYMDKNVTPTRNASSPITTEVLSDLEFFEGIVLHLLSDKNYIYFFPLRGIFATLN